jgi:hypothetical protein
MGRPVVLLAAALLVAACGAAPPPDRREAPPPARPAAPSPSAAAPVAQPAAGAFRFVGTPDVRFYHAAPNPETNVWFITTVRVNRPLPQDAHGVDGEVSIIGASSYDIPGLEHIGDVQRCYIERNPVASERRLPRDGQLVIVRLKIGGRHPQTLTARTAAREIRAADAFSERLVAAVESRLGCPPAARERACGDAVGGEPTIFTSSAGGGATCATARRVMLAVARWADSRRCFEDLCVRGHRVNRGFRCTVAKVGEADWTITCKRGREVVRGSSAE